MTKLANLLREHEVRISRVEDTGFIEIEAACIYEEPDGSIRKAVFVLTPYDMREGYHVLDNAFGDLAIALEIDK